ncbi:Aste57867_10788 [Aphanomyces stellatus]|uniref:Aste57867_10788 protein n=1 Tax=Aphanomyces stellatus TaxID=120398 RepID=A0A485KRV6_9STRA|nr:hypothetical protein As57867_010748 [Aphanomyces stellatus]VFT87657.1 Aste57867_10788 [Aphanomyces stellatus]
MPAAVATVSPFQSPRDRRRCSRPSMHFYDARDEIETTARPHKATKRQRTQCCVAAVVPGKLHGMSPPDTPSRRRQRIPAAHAVVRHDPVDYLALRRTEWSQRALARARQQIVAQEVLVPSHLSPSSSSMPTLSERIAALDDLPLRVAEPAPVVVWEVPAAAKTHMDTLVAETAALAAAQIDAHAAIARETSKVRHVLDDVRTAIASMYTFTPTFRIYMRFKTQSAIERWRTYVEWHRAESARLFQLTHFAVRIQRAYRARHGRLAGFVARAAQRHAEWAAAIRLQGWVRGVVTRVETQRLRESHVAVCLQKAWRGRVGRLVVKQRLKDMVRAILRQLSPTGSLHRLRDVALYRGEMRRTLERMLGLVEDVSVSLREDTNAPPPSPPRAELHIREWYNAIAELEALVAARQVEIHQAKRQYETQRALRLAAARERDASDHATALTMAVERVRRANELIAMYREEGETREFLRMTQVSAVDDVYRRALREKRAEKEACLAMQREELETRHVVAERRWREADRRLRMGEVDKLENYRQMEAEAAAERMQEWVDTMLAKQDAWSQLHDEQKRQRMAHWEAKTKQELVGLYERMEARKVQKAAEKAQRKQRKRQRQQEQADRVTALEQSRVARIAELERQFHERVAMEADERHMGAWLSEQKKADEAKLWEAMRMEAAKARPDPLALPPDEVSTRQALERERQALLAMAHEEARTRRHMAQMAKETFLRESKERKRRRDIEAKAEAKTQAAMEAEETEERARLKKLADRAAYHETLKRMQAADEGTSSTPCLEIALGPTMPTAYRAREAEKLFEARCRKLMHDEEMRLHRLYTEVLYRQRLRERKERHLMHNDELYMRRILDEREKLRLRRLEKTRRVEMAVEDVRSHQWHALEIEGTNIGRAIWSAQELKALSMHVRVYPDMLRVHIILLAHITGLQGDPPWKRVHWIPPTDIGAPASVDVTLAQMRWNRIRNTYMKKTLAANEARRGAEELQAGELHKAQISLRMAFRDGYKGARLVRNIAKCYVKLYEANLNDNDLRLGWVWYLKASTHVELQASPIFLDEFAHALYLSGHFQHAAEVLARVIYNFPSYSRLQTVIFRAAVLMWHLGLYEQATDYFLHLLETPPPPWTDLDLMFFIARLYLLDEDKAHATFAYDDAFRRYHLHGFRFHYASWKAWVADAGVWRHFGAKALAAREYLVAKDMYQQVVKRRHDEVRVAHREKERDLDWFHLAQCQTMLHEYVPAGLTIGHWLGTTQYALCVLERVHAWSSATWQAMGTAPTVAWDNDDKPDRSVERTTATPKPIKRKRKPLATLRKKRIRRQRKKIVYRSTAELQQWVEMTDVNTGKTFYYNEKTFDISWARPV